MEVTLKEKGKEALTLLNLPMMNPELVRTIGQFYLRYSYGQNLWIHSLEVAKICENLAIELELDPVLAKKAGLLHDIGKVVLNDYVRFGYGIIVKMVEEEQIPFTEAEFRVLGFDHAMVGEILVERWDLPKGYQCAVAYHHKPNELPEEFAEFQPLLDVVSVANSMCLMLGIGIGADSMQNYMFPEPLERLGITNFEALMSDLVDFASKATEEMADMRGF